MLPPVVDTVNSTYLVISWPEPRFPNGILVQYSLSLVRANTVDAPTVVTVPGTDLNTTVSTLMPFTLYQLQLTAFTSRGSTSSTTVLQRTAEDSKHNELFGLMVKSSSVGYCTCQQCSYAIHQCNLQVHGVRPM